MNNMKFAFVSRHTPTQGQVDLAAAKGIELVHVGDADAFTITPEWVKVSDAQAAEFVGVVVVHPAAALRLAPFYPVGIFENANRAEPGQPPQFEAVSFHLYNLNLTGDL